MAEDKHVDARHGDKYIYFRTRLNTTEGKKLVALLREASRKEEDPDCARRFAAIAQDLVEAGKGEFHTYNRPVKRPKDDDEMALERVIKGDAPFPVLSRMDAYRAFLSLDGKENTGEIARRLHVDKHTIGDWRKKYRTGELKVDE